MVLGFKNNNLFLIGFDNEGNLSVKAIWESDLYFDEV